MTDPRPEDLDDDALVAAFLVTDGIAGDPHVDALLAEIERRELDF